MILSKQIPVRYTYVKPLIKTNLIENKLLECFDSLALLLLASTLEREPAEGGEDSSAIRDI